jgi:UDP-glucose 4-epimerase
VLDDLSGGFSDQIPVGAQFIEGSVCDHDLLARLFERHRFDYVYHLAAYAAEGLSHFIRRFNYTHNLVGSANLINESIKHEVKCFVFTSSIAVYGAGQNPMHEDMTPVPEDPYGISKYAVELDLRAAHEMFGMNYIVFRPHNVYGEHQNIGDRYRNVVGIFMNQIMHGEPMTIFGNGTQTRAFSYIADVAPVIAGSVHNSKALNQVINVGAEHPYSVRHLADVVARTFRVLPEIRFLPARKEVQHAYSDHSKAHQLFGTGAGVSLEEGVGRMAAWAQRVGGRKSRNFSSIEVRQHLPASWQD